MAHLEGFDASKVDPAGPSRPVPEGAYVATIVYSERKKNKSGNGEHLELRFHIQDGPHQGRVVVSRLNLWNENEMAKHIAQSEMSAICRAVGVMQPNDSSDLHHLPLEILVGQTAPNAQGRIYNEITGYQKRRPAPDNGARQTTPPPRAATPGTSGAGERPSEEQPAWFGN
ncbi:MAG: DUF669 domain-containing protein [Planctomycetes bacterium]|nr:DUF669 domain-containing protein [Planctomycetota bacterium]MCD7897474.1 DUF669 domain-containing protein [Planctomycetaceae bacterium]